MPSLFDNRKRLILPRWRNIYGKSSSIILSTEKGPRISLGLFEDTFEEKKTDFRNTATFSNAIEVVNTAFSMGKENDAVEEAKFITSMNRDLPSGLASIVKNILKSDNKDIIEDNKEMNDPLLKNIFVESGKNITLLRHRIKKFYYNPLLWLELSRLYSILGYIDKAEAAAQVALQLSKNSNRLITRSVSRFYIHKKDFEKAQSIVRSSPLFGIDPWLIACDISYSRTMKRQPTSIKAGTRMIENKSFSTQDLTELAAALATEKFLTDDNSKEGRQLFHLALGSPNDNSFAQAEFFLKEFSEKKKLINVIPYNYEAQAQELYNIKKYGDSFKHSFKWLVDQPFSRRAAYFNSYLLSGVLENHEKAIEFGKFSLKSNPDSFLLNNNVAFSYASLNKVKDAKIYIKKARQTLSEPSDIIVLDATEGMLLYREGRIEDDKAKIEKGREFYIKAIRESERQKNKQMNILAILNFAREEYLSNSITKEVVEKLISSIDKRDLENDDTIERNVQKLQRVMMHKAQ